MKKYISEAAMDKVIEVYTSVCKNKEAIYNLLIDDEDMSEADIVAMLQQISLRWKQQKTVFRNCR